MKLHDVQPTLNIWQPDNATSHTLGSIDYDAGHKWQERLAADLLAGHRGETLMLLQHPPTITIGRGGGWEDLRTSPALIERAGVALRESDRGGKGTYHGPGQLVAYPIMRVKRERLGTYLHNLEQVVIDLLAEYGIGAGRETGHAGVWVAEKKIAAVGLAIRDGITRHGLSLNIAPDMKHYQLLVPCGIVDKGVTSMQQLLEETPTLPEVSQRFARHFARVYRRKLTYRTEVCHGA